ncbi:hypothetical protein CROQUDRAFT_650774 [Cronartium quercuum f. sp. fusiforme G11]|uniref:Uncharacterized protein n=1 Tax=Cronartium quercuum f. sp. fusiforme G11 TaxID=708437 RepID=A0A9P6TGG2_9BASI|nr:hypothetical protein CROQUDRAFT_650774 [Cronartium quercuum f. sp. fusiforme G11]
MLTSPVQWNNQNGRFPIHSEGSPTTPQQLVHPISPTSSEQDHDQVQSPDQTIRQLANSLSMSSVEDHVGWKGLDADFCRVEVIRSNQRLRIPLITVEGKVVSCDISSGGRQENLMVSENSETHGLGLLPSLGIGEPYLFSGASISTPSRCPSLGMRKRKSCNQDTEMTESSSNDQLVKVADDGPCLTFHRNSTLEPPSYSRTDQPGKRVRTA